MDKKEEDEQELSGGLEALCSRCQKRPAEIFQADGDFCLECWQIITHTNA